MYLIGLLIYLAFLIGTTLLVGLPVAFVDFPSIILILAFSFSMLLASGLLPDFFRGFQLMGKKVNTFTLVELRKTETALSLSMKLLLLSGFVGSLIGVIAILTRLSDMSLSAQSLAMALLTLLYSVLLVIILLPIKAKVRAIIQTLD